MTAIALPARTDNAPARYDPTSSPLAVWAESARQASIVAGQLAGTPFVPQSLRGVKTRPDQTQEDLDRITVGNITATILTGQELGLHPMAALRSMDVIQGTPALRAITLRALVQAHGHEVWLEESTATRAIVSGRRKGSDKVQTSTWTIDRARALGLIGKDNWKKQPGAMLIARASSECCRLVAADVIMAMPYSVEELYDGDEWVVEEETPSKPATARRTAQRRNTPAPAIARPQVKTEERVEEPEPEFDEPAAGPQSGEESGRNPGSTPGPLPAPGEDEPTPEFEPESPETITKPQSGKLHATFNDYGIKNRAERLRISAAIINRELTSSSDLTKEEASSLIDTLDSLLAAAQASGEDPRERLLLICDVGEDNGASE